MAFEIYTVKGEMDGIFKATHNTIIRLCLNNHCPVVARVNILCGRYILTI